MASFRTQHLSLPNLKLPQLQTHTKSHFSKTHLSINPSNPSNSNSSIITLQDYCLSIIKRRRTLNLSVIALIVSSSLSLSFPTLNAIAAADDDELERYTDSVEGFTLLRPSSYIKVDKAGATVLFEEMNKGANNVGVVVNPVRLTSLRDFGTPQFVVDKLIQAEKRKESTKDAEVVGASERPGLAGLPVYEFEYLVDSTRGGMKRIFSAAFVSQKKLYLLNISHSDKPESPLDDHTRMVLERVLHSFDAAPLT